MISEQPALESKRCTRCLIEKPLRAFYGHPSMSDGRLNQCMECKKADGKARRAAKKVSKEVSQ